MELIAKCLCMEQQYSKENMAPLKILGEGEGYYCKYRSKNDHTYVYISHSKEINDFCL